MNPRLPHPFPLQDDEITGYERDQETVGIDVVRQELADETAEHFEIAYEKQQGDRSQRHPYSSPGIEGERRGGGIRQGQPGR